MTGRWGKGVLYLDGRHREGLTDSDEAGRLSEIWQRELDHAKI